MSTSNLWERAKEAVLEMSTHKPSTGRSMKAIRSDAKALLADLGQVEYVEGTATVTDSVVVFHSDEHNERPALLLLLKEIER